MIEEKKVGPCKYATGKIYKMYKRGQPGIYIGSTIHKLCRRLTKHRYDAKRRPDVKVYKTLGDMTVVEIELIENFPCRSKDELLWRERYHQEQLKPELNSDRAIVTPLERHAHHRALDIANKRKVRATPEGKAAALAAKQKWRAKQVVKTCDCGGLAKQMSTHLKTKKHVAWAATQIRGGADAVAQQQIPAIDVIGILEKAAELQ